MIYLLGLLPGPAKAIECHTRCVQGPTRIECRHPGDVHRVVAAAGATAHHDVVDLGRIESVALLERVQDLREQSLLPFDLDGGPLMRISLLRVGDVQHVLFFNQHHAVSDGWSIEFTSRAIGNGHVDFPR